MYFLICLASGQLCKSLLAK